MNIRKKKYRVIRLQGCNYRITYLKRSKDVRKVEEGGTKMRKKKD
jgi:DNA-directed RNA polymerase subunit RPC12/RpoP